IGIADGSIEAVGESVEEVVFKLLKVMEAEDADTLTVLAGEDICQEDFETLLEEIESVYDDIEIDPHRGEQPLYPLILSVE
ncbi:MAG: DAK2 domain-containing protein, partial [Coriobacteriaceae bacterium]|nr:DAK2 domain-containing protein [Coriobacteriaceae bacterium]